MLTCRIDFVSCTITSRSESDLCSLVSAVSAFVPSASGWGFLQTDRYPKSLRSVGGLLGSLRLLRSESLYHLRLEMPGQFCRLADLHPLCKFLSDSRFRITRLDIALDDFCRRVDFPLVRAAGEVGNYRLVDSFKVIESSPMPGFPPVGSAYFGKSSKVLRFYNAEAVHGIPADRWELQLREDLARAAFDHFLADPASLPSLLVSAVDFGVPSEHYRDFARFSWWQSLIDEIGFVLPLSSDSYSPDLSRTLKWLDKSVAPTLAVLREGLDDRFLPLLNALCDNGYSRLSPYHFKWIDAIIDHAPDPFAVLRFTSEDEDI